MHEYYLKVDKVSVTVIFTRVWPDDDGPVKGPITFAYVQFGKDVTHRLVGQATMNPHDNFDELIGFKKALLQALQSNPFNGPYLVITKVMAAFVQNYKRLNRID